MWHVDLISVWVKCLFISESAYSISNPDIISHSLSLSSTCCSIENRLLFVFHVPLPKSNKGLNLVPKYILRASLHHLGATLSV